MQIFAKNLTNRIFIREVESNDTREKDIIIGDRIGNVREVNSISALIFVR